MTQLYRINLCKKLIGISEILETNSKRQNAMIQKLNAYDKVDAWHPIRICNTKDELIEELETRIFVGKRLEKYYTNTLTKLNESK